MLTKCIKYQKPKVMVEFLKMFIYILTSLLDKIRILRNKIIKYGTAFSLFEYGKVN